MVTRMTDGRILAKYWSLPIPRLKQMFEDINALGEYIIESFERDGKVAQAAERRSKLGQQKKLQSMFLLRRENPQAFQEKYKTILESGTPDQVFNDL